MLMAGMCYTASTLSKNVSKNTRSARRAHGLVNVNHILTIVGPEEM